MALRDKYSSVRGKAIPLSLAVMMATFFSGAATAQELATNQTPGVQTVETTPTTAATTASGLPVTLRIGPGFDTVQAISIRDGLNAAGCPTTMTQDGLFDEAIDVEVGDSYETFEKTGSASNYALKACRR